VPALGGEDDGIKFRNIYKETLEFYEALFGEKPNKQIWEPVEERFASELFNCSMINLNRLVAYMKSS